MPSTSRTVKVGVGATLAVALSLILLSALAPLAITGTVGTESTTLTQAAGNTYTITGDLQTNATSVTSTDATINVSDSGDSETNTVSVGSTVEYTVGGDAVNVTVDSVNTSTTPNQTTVTYNYTVGAGWQGESQDIFSVLPIVAIIAVLLAFVAIGIRYL